MERDNDWIFSRGNVKGKKDRKILNVWTNKKRIHTRPLTVPIDAPEIDPYNKSTGNGFMTPNAIMKSGLSANAKLLFTALRSYICYELGVVFPTEEQLRERMSKDIKSISKAVKELELYGVILTSKIYRNRSVKKYYDLLPESQWKLPKPDKYAYRPAENEDTPDDLELEEAWNDAQSEQDSSTSQNDVMS